MAKCVLIVDDDPGVIALVKSTLLGQKLDVLTAGNGEEALEVLKGKKPDLILLDVQMPKMDGYGFIMKKNQDPAIAAIPVIMLTAMGKTEPLFQRHGIKAYLLKPINTPELLQKIQTILGV